MSYRMKPTMARRATGRSAMSKSSGSSFQGSSAKATPSPVNVPTPATSSLQPPTNGLPCCCIMLGRLLASLSDFTLGLDKLGVFG